MADIQYTNDQIAEFASRDLVIAFRASPYNLKYDYMSTWLSDQTIGGAYLSDNAPARTTVRFGSSHFCQRYSHQNRMVGVIIDDNDDGSFMIKILGTDTLHRNTNAVGVRVLVTGDGDNTADGKMYVSPVADDNDIHISEFGNDITTPEWFDFTPTWQKYSGNNAFYQRCTEKGNKTLNDDITLTTDTSNALVVGKPITGYPIVTNYLELPYIPTEIYDNISGNLWECAVDYLSIASASVTGVPAPEDKTWRALPVITIYLQPNGTFAAYWKPYNLILTRDEQQAKNYLNTGAIPSDTIIYPWNPDEFPTYKSDGSDPEEGGDEPGENGTPVIDLPDMVEPQPDYTPQRLTNNNLYWLTAGQLTDFINWFWTSAGDIASLNDLWEKIQGLYNDLASSILNIRYMPVKPLWIGGTSSTTSIVVGNIVDDLGGATVEKINNNNPTKQTIGHIKINEVISKIDTAKGFTNYTPYAQLLLYLPFHGYFELDNDLYMNSTLLIKALYDIISGVIQYELYRVADGKQTLTNIIPCKMAVDIPITLQSKNDRDSAIFQNIVGLAGSLAVSGGSLATGNPLGLVMGANALTSAGANSLPLSLKGTPQETGAFYTYNKCMLIIKRPVYNRPSIYKSRVGYPCNKSYKLGSDKLKGFTQVYNPQIAFSGNTNADNVTIKPLQSEIDEIYTALEKGVII